MSRPPFKIGGKSIPIGTRQFVELDVAALFDLTKISIPLEIIHGKLDGPTVFISAAIHGDEINGIEIIKKLRNNSALKNIKGTLILAPIVNVFGYNAKSRYLPDRRDLNRSFPGRMNGSLAGRMAHLFMKEIVRHCQYGIDLHTGAINRQNYPQIRADMRDEETEELVKSFGAPVVVNSRLRDGSLREAARKEGVKILLYEGGEALRFDDSTIKTGVKGCLSVLEHIGMIKNRRRKKSGQKKVFIAEGSQWLRAPHSGSYQTTKKLGETISKGEEIAVITDPFGQIVGRVNATMDGLIVGMSSLPLVNQGDAMFHIAYFEDEGDLEEFEDVYDEEGMDEKN